MSAVETLQSLLLGIRDPNLVTDEGTMQRRLLRRAKTFGVADGNAAASAMTSKRT